MRSFAPLVFVALASLAAGLATPATRSIGPYPGDKDEAGLYFCNSDDCSGDFGDDSNLCSFIPYSSLPPGGSSDCLGTFAFHSVYSYTPAGENSLPFNIFVETQANDAECGNTKSTSAVEVSKLNTCFKLPGAYNLLFKSPL